MVAAKRKRRDDRAVYAVTIPTNKGMQLVELRAGDSFEAVEVASSRLQKRNHIVNRLAADGAWHIDRDEKGRKVMTLMSIIA